MHSVNSRAFFYAPARYLTLVLFAAAMLHCGPDHPAQAPDPDEIVGTLALSPSNPQIAQGTAQQFSLRSLRADGHTRDLTAKVKWSVRTPDGTELPLPSSPSSGLPAGLIGLAQPGRYLVTAEYAGRRIDTDLSVTAATLTSVSISPRVPKVAKGLTQQFTATGTFSDGSTQDVSAISSWSIKDEVGSGVAIVNTLGLLTTKSVGKARITVKLLTRSSWTTIEVTPAALKTLVLSPTSPSVAKGTSQRFTATGTFTDATVQDVTTSADWAVMDVMGRGVASIDGTGTAVGEAVGQAKVSAEYLGITAETMMTVTPAAPVSVSLSPTSASIAKGTTQQFTATAKLTDGSNQDVSSAAAWTSTDVMGSSVASVDLNGLARANSVGTASIRCDYRGFSATASLEVKPALLTAIAISPAMVTVAKGRTQAFALIGSYTDGSTQDLTGSAVWTISDLMGLDVASITAGGSTFAKNIGQARIKAEHMGKSATATLTVGAAALTSLAITPGSASIALGATQQFKATGSYTDGSTQDHSAAATWSVTDLAPATGVATISLSGLATGKSKGAAAVAATFLGITAQATLAVGLPAGVCSSGGWCWRNPLPQGNYLPAVWASDANNAWAVSDFGVILRWNGSDWLQQASASTQNLLAIWGSDTNNIWAVGVGGTILKWNGTAWAAQLSGTTQNLSAVWGSDASNVWAAGANGTMLKWNGTAWSAQPSGSTQYLRGLWGTSASNVWAVGGSGTILRWNGTAWAAQLSGTFEYLRAIWGSDTNNVWAVGSLGSLLKWDGTTWTAQSSGTSTNLRTIWGSDAKNIWVAGDSGTLLKGDGTTWTAQSSGTSLNLVGLGGSAANSVWVVGNNGVILRWNGTLWAAYSKGSYAGSFGVWGSDANNIWAAGEAGSISKWNGTAWVKQTSGSTAWLFDVWGLDANNVWAVGLEGTILKWNGTAWSAQSSGSLAKLNEVWGTDANNIWVTGDEGTLLRWNGTAWSKEVSGTISNLYGVWGTGASSIWTVGSSGTILKWNGTAWSAEVSGTTSSLFGLWGADANNLWAVGTGGGIVKWNGTSWSAQPSGTTQTLSGVWGSDASNVWAVGALGTALKWNGTAWSPQVTGSSQDLTDVWGTDAKNVWTVGGQGTLLQYAP